MALKGPSKPAMPGPPALPGQLLIADAEQAPELPQSQPQSKPQRHLKAIPNFAQNHRQSFPKALGAVPRLIIQSPPPEGLPRCAASPGRLAKKKVCVPRMLKSLCASKKEGINKKPTCTQTFFFRIWACGLWFWTPKKVCVDHI